MRKPANPHTHHLTSGYVSVGNMYPTPARVPNNMFISPVSPQGSLSIDSSRIPQPLKDRVPIPPAQFSNTDVHTTISVSRPVESKDLPWSVDALQGFLDYPDSTPTVTGQLPSSSGDGNGTFSDWAKQLISADDGLEPNWSEILADVDAADARSKVCSLT